MTSRKHRNKGARGGDGRRRSVVKKAELHYAAVVGPRGAKLDELGIGNGGDAAGLKLVAIRSALNEVTVVTAEAAFFVIRSPADFTPARQELFRLALRSMIADALTKKLRSDQNSHHRHVSDGSSMIEELQHWLGVWDNNRAVSAIAQLDEAVDATSARVDVAGRARVPVSEGAAYFDISNVALCDFCSGAADATSFEWSLALPGGSLSAMSELLSEIVSAEDATKHIVAKLTEWGWAMGVGDLIMRKSEVMTTSCSSKI